MPHSKRSLLSSLKTNWQAKLSGFILLLMACGPGPADYNEFMSYFMPEASNAAPADARYHFSPNYFYVDAYNDTLQDAHSENVQAWVAYSQNKVSAKAIEAYFYGNKTSEMALPNALKNNKEASSYLTLAKAIDAAYKPQVNEWDIPELDTLKLVPMLAMAQQALPKTKDSFLRERYLFQAIKLACMTGQYQKAIDLYEIEASAIKNKTLISHWARSRYAGALLHLDQKDKAFYHFAQVFVDCPSKRKEADLSVRTWHLTLPAGAINLCKNDQEKASVYALAGIQPNVDALPFMEKMVALSPNNSNLELMMCREINKNEMYFYPQAVDYYTGEDNSNSKDQAKSIDYFEQLETFAEKCSVNKNLGNQAFWLTATAYMAYIRNDYTKAEAQLALAQKSPTDNVFLKQQMGVQDILLAIKKSPGISPALENKAIDFLEKYHQSSSFRTINAVSKVCELLANKYQGEPTQNADNGGWWSSCGNTKTAEKNSSTIANGPAKAFFIRSLASYQHNNGYAYGYTAQHDQYALEDSTAYTTIQTVLAYYQQASPSAFDKRLFKISEINGDYLYTLLGRRALNEHRYETAQKDFAKVKNLEVEPFISNLATNPFYIKPNNGQAEKQRFSPLTFAQKMVELNQLGLNGDPNAWYLLGCGAYNTSYYGNAWILKRRAWSSTENPAEAIDYQVSTPGNTKLDADYYNNVKAKTYFEKALALCKDAELKAKILYMLATLEEQNFQTLLAKNYPDYSSDNYEAIKEAYLKKMAEIKQKDFNKYFKQLKNQTDQSQYKALIIRECSVYQDFVGK